MDLSQAPPGPAFFLQREALDRLIRALQEGHYQVVGPRLAEGAIIYDVIEGIQDLPAGWSDEQEAGHYRLKRRDDGALFGYNLGPQSWKKFLHPPQLRIFCAERRDGDFRILSEGEPAPRYAFVGVRACELAAIAVQDRVLLGDQFIEPHYQARREGVFLIAVQCTQAAATCFCSSMGTGPRVQGGYDILLTELPEEQGFLAQPGSGRGIQLLEAVGGSPASEQQRMQAAQRVEQVENQIRRRVDTRDIVRRLYDAYADPRWDHIAARCLACGNCTMVCPTCFCTTVEDASNARGDRAERWRKWDSCFTESFSYIHGGSVRMSVRSRYRQWLTHKFAAWVDQFDMFGCVGCGRCIAWCPAKIDVTEEVREVTAAVG